MNEPLLGQTKELIIILKHIEAFLFLIAVIAIRNFLLSKSNDEPQWLESLKEWSLYIAIIVILIIGLSFYAQ